MTTSINGDYPLVPRYRGTGPHWALLWTCHNEGNNILVARSPESLARAYATILRSISDARAIKQYEGHIVLPPDWLTEAHRIREREQDVDNYRHYVLFRLEDYRKLRWGRLPHPFCECPKYQPPADAKPGEFEDADSVKRHAMCVHCDGKRIALSEGTWESYFDERGGDVAGENTHRSTATTPAPILDGERADPLAPLYVIGGGFHGIGVVLAAPGEENIPDCNRASFFLQGEEREPYGAVAEMQAAHSRARAEEKRRKEEREATHRREHKDKLDRDIIEFFEAPARLRQARGELLAVLQTQPKTDGGDR